MINEKGVTWRCAAHQPRFAPFHLRFHPLLRPSFGFSFLLPFFFSLCFVIPMLYLLCQRNPAPFSLLFLSSRAVQPSPTDISISTFVALSNFTLLHFYAITFRDVAPLYTFSLSDSAVANDSLEFLPVQPFIQLRLSANGSESSGLLSRSLLQNPRSLHLRYYPVRTLRTVSPVDYPRLPFNPHPYPSATLVPESIAEAKCRFARTWQPSIRTRDTGVKMKL